MLHEHARADAGLLAWWRLAGFDTMVADAPTPWLCPTGDGRVTEAAERSVQATAAPLAAVIEHVETRAEALARSADSPAALAAAAREFAGPDARLFDGVPESGLLFVVDAPCPENDRRLLDGPEGRLFDRMLHAIGRDRTRAAVATAALRPDAAPAPAFLNRLIALARPRALVALGGAATTILTGRAQGLNRLRGQWLEAGEVPVLATFHPAHLLLHPAHKALAWADLLALVKKLDT